MKPVLTIFIFSMLIGTAVRAQKEFAPLGAEWYHEMRYGIFHSVAVSDTVIKGESCRKIVQRAGRNPFHTFMGPFVNDMPTIYMHNNGTGDTIFLYNELFQKFTPLYVFNVQAGDTVCLPVFPPHGTAITPKGDSTFCFIVDSVKMVQYDTTWLETVYNHPVNLSGYIEFDYEGPYVRHIINASAGLLPFCSTCVYPLTESIQWAGDLRCYHDEHTDIKLVTDECSKGIKVSVDDIPNGYSFEVFPNPAKDRLTVSGYGLTSGVTISINDMQGRTILADSFQPDGSNIVLDISSLAPGVYNFSLSTTEGFEAYQRVVVIP